MQIDYCWYSKDLKIINNTVVSDWWRKNGHSVGSSDLADIFAVNPQVLVIGQGMPGLMKSTSELREKLSAKHIKLFEEPTPQAIKTFNSLVEQGRNVAACFHLTC